MPDEELIQRALQEVVHLTGESKSGDITGEQVADALGIPHDDPGAELYWALKTADERGHIKAYGFGGMSLPDVIRL